MKEPIDELYQRFLRNGSGMSHDLGPLNNMATNIKGCRVVEAALHASGSTVAFLAARPRLLVTFNKNDGGQLNTDLHGRVPAGVEYQSVAWNGVGQSLPDCDLLFYNMEPHSGPAVYEFLRTYSGRVGRFIAVHGTTVYGQQWNHLPGVFTGLRQFVAENPGWRCVYIGKTSLGLTVLSKDPSDGPAVAIPESVVADPVKAQPQAQQVTPPGFGPGTELKAMLEAIGVVFDPNTPCDCNGNMIQMDFWGVAGCKQHKNRIVGDLLDGYVRWGWADKFGIQSPTAEVTPGTWARLAAAWKVVRSGLAMKIDPNDVFRSMVDEAIRRAEEKGQK